MSLWDLNDACLNNILKYAYKYGVFVSNDDHWTYHWNMTCPQFKEFYDKTFFKDKLQEIARTKAVSLNEDKDTLDEIIQRNINIDEVYGLGLTNSDLSAIDLFPGIKRLTLRNCQLTGKYINELTDLEILELEDIEGLQPKNLSLIFKNNELRVLKLLRVPGAFTEHLAYEISQNLIKQEGEDVQQLEELAISSDEIDGCQALGCLRYLRKLEIDISHLRLYSCEFQKCAYFFNELSNNINLQELKIINGIVTRNDFEILTMLRKLKKLTFHVTAGVDLRDFCRFSHLEELHLFSTFVYMKELMTILRDCPQLTVFTIKMFFDYTTVKFSAASHLIKMQNRYKLPVRVRVSLSLETGRLSELVRKHTYYLNIEEFFGNDVPVIY
ncbi:uncharacterized protein LOC105216433 [Zeugodacus cucurbitae]|uniref:uncharacterized protein LOC105216433 n=1 Tax=Zeugodacus cucurbitae TaxID=28588 RepID=UPI0023D8F577|nr:uncharacterized protein LOC105216433 [Zeugodacus cucurbitae]